MKKIAVASGKGGTGKTTVSLLLARILSKKYKVHLADCDVENPDCHLFFDINCQGQSSQFSQASPWIEFVSPVSSADKASDLRASKIKEQSSRDVTVFYPDIDLQKCFFCGRCQEICEYNCLLTLKDKVMFFKEMCHPCRGCLIVCPQKAVKEGRRPVGKFFSYAVGKNLFFSYAVMNVGEARANPLIEDIKDNLKENSDYIIFDSPPGASCPMVETVKGCDYVILVTEPTPFGLYDLQIAYNVIKKINIPCGIVINRAEKNDKIIENFAKKENLKIMFKIPFSREFAYYYSKGIIKENFFPEIEKEVLNIL